MCVRKKSTNLTPPQNNHLEKNHVTSGRKISLLLMHTLKHELNTTTPAKDKSEDHMSLKQTNIIVRKIIIIQGDLKNMSPLAFKSNNSRPMSRTTLPDTAFERADNFLSNECIHTRFPFQIASSQAANQKWSGFCVFRFQTDFDEREYFVLSSLYRNIAFS